MKIEQTRFRQTPVRLLSTLAMLCGLLVPVASALELSETGLFFELNHTDSDLGIHASIDGGPYTMLEIEGPRGRTLLKLKARGRLARQGMTQFMLESAEPTFDELSPERFFKRFPEGEYEIEISRGREELEEVLELSHVLAAPAESWVNGIPASEDCDAVVPEVVAPVVVDWDPVTKSHPDIGRYGPVEIVRYQLFVEQDESKFSIDLPADVTEFEVPLSITDAGGEFKFEIIAQTADLNNTAIESCFFVESPQR